MVEVPDDLLYDPNHIWVKEEDGVFVVGWTAFAVQSAGDIAYVTLPRKGTKIEAGKEFGSIETGKWVGRLTSPVTGEVIEVNERAMVDPELVNETPYSEGWFLRIRSDLGPSTKLLSAQEYLEIVKAGKAF